MNFRPNKKKVIVSIVIIIIWYSLIFMLASSIRIQCIMPICEDVDVFEFSLIPYPTCVCPEATTFLEIIVELMIILFPGILSYIIWSLFEKKSKPFRLD